MLKCLSTWSLAMIRFLQYEKELGHNITYKNAYAPSDDSAWPVHPRNLTRVFAVHLKTQCPVKTLIRLRGSAGWYESSVTGCTCILVWNTVSRLKCNHVLTNHARRVIQDTLQGHIIDMLFHHLGRAKRKCVFKHAQNAQIQITLRMRKVSSGFCSPFIIFFSIQGFS